MDQPLDYVVWEPEWKDGVCRLGMLQNVEKHGELAYNIPRAEGFPANATFEMDRDARYDTLLADRLRNASGFLVVSEQVVRFLEEREVPHFESLPVKILDHRGKPVDQPYFIVNPLDPVDCLDVEACDPSWNKILPGKIRSVRRLVIDPDRMDPSRPLFTCDKFHRARFLRRDLAKAMDDAGFTGSVFVEIGEYRA